MTQYQDLTLTWRGEMADDEMATLTASHGGQLAPGWWDRIRPHSLGWVTAREPGASELVGFTNVAWDGGVHAFLLDPKVRPDHQRRGLGTAVVRLAAEEAAAAGCEWLHVDFEDTERLSRFYFGACRFRPTTAGLIRLLDLL